MMEHEPLRDYGQARAREAFGCTLASEQAHPSGRPNGSEAYREEPCVRMGPARRKKRLLRRHAVLGR